jgi:hypothetical protein
VYKIHRGKRLPVTFPIQNGLEQGDALPLLFFGFALEYGFQLCFKVRYRAGARKQSGTGIEWDTSAFCLHR